ncbi:histidine kinase [Lishizhenia sp.]|uniref:sensor histidine kinase n=1 Tax=Lishizhenia sp. TaxID=2497594 RepID=UPI00299E244D|nr:histidine kinase [Lishizhenia sp.]MDX1446411.1 histidine kinase [Lishizhenia sp.]
MSELLNVPSLETYKIKQDTKGNIWILTDAGVVQYNGSSTRLFTSKDGLSSSTIFDMYEDQFERIWFIGSSSDLCYYKDDEIHTYQYNDTLRKILNGKVRIWKELYVDANDILYYSINGNGCLKITKDGKISNLKQKDGIEIIPIEQHHLISFNILKQNYRHGKNKDSLALDFYFKKYHQKAYFIRINSINQTHQIIGGSNFHIIYNRLLRDTTFLETEEDVVYITPYQKEVLIATPQGFYRGKTMVNHVQRTSPLMLPNEYITSILVDNRGAIWVSTLENGIFYFPDFKLGKSSYIHATTDKNINKIFTFKNDLYALSYSSLFNVSQKSYHTTVGGEEFCNFLTIGDELVLSKGGIIIPYKNSYAHILPFSRDLKVAGSKIFVSSSDRIYTITLDSLKSEAFFTPLDHSTFSYSKKIALIDSTTILHSGLEKISILKKHEFVKELQGKFNVQQMSRTSDQRILILEKNKGLFYLDLNTLEIKPLDKINHLLPEVEFNTFAYSQDRKEYFIGSNSGLFIYKDSENCIKHIDKNHGISSNQVNSLHIDKDMLYFGIKGNLYSYDLASESETSPITPPVFGASLMTSDSISINIDQQTNFILPSTEKFFEIKLKTHSYSNWFNKQYQFRTDSTNTWITTNSPSFTITNLNGKYNIEARYKINAFTWSPPFEIVSIQVTPPWYKAWYALLLYFILLGAVILLIVRFRVQRKMKKLQIQNNLLSYQQRLNNARIKPHFIFNVLNSINSHIHFNETKQASNYLIKFSNLMRNILEKSGNDEILIAKEIELLNSYLELELIRKEDKFQFHLDIPMELKTASIPSMLIQPIVENAVLHGTSNHDNVIRIQFSYHDKNSVKVEIANKGSMTKDQIFKWNNSPSDHAVGITRDRINNFKILFNNKELAFYLINEENWTRVIIILPVYKN